MENLSKLIAITNQNNLSDLLKTIDNIKETKDHSNTQELINLIETEQFPGNINQEMGKKIKISCLKTLGALKEKNAIPSIIKNLNTKNTMIKNAATRALGKIGDISALDSLHDMLKDELTKVAAVKSLGEIGSEQSIDYLIGMLKDKDVETRTAAAISLGQLKNIKALGDLTRALEEDSDVNVRRLAAIAIGEIGEEAPVPVLIKKLDDQYMNVATSAADALVKIGRTSVKNLADVIENKLAADALIKIGEPSVDELINLLTHEKEITREIAAKCLGKIGNTRAIKPLIENLDKNSDKCLKTMRDAIFFICKSSLHLLAEALNENPVTSEAITEIFFDIGHLTDNGIEKLIKELKTDNPTYQKFIIKAMGKLGDIKVIPVLQELFLSTNNIELKREILKTLNSLGPREEILELYIKAAENSDEEIKILAIEGIIHTGEPSTADILIEQLNKGSDNLKKLSAKGLGQINNSIGNDALLKAINTENQDLKITIIQSLSKKRDERANTVFIELLDNPAAEIQMAAIKAIGSTENKDIIIHLKPLLKSSDEKVREEVKRILSNYGINTSKSLWSRLFNLD